MYILIFKVAMIDMRYFPRSTFFDSLVHEKFFCHIHVVFKLGYLFTKELEYLLSLNELGEKLRVTSTICKFENKL